MSRPFQPTAKLEAKGAFIKDPQRRRNNEPKPRGPLSKTPPKDFSPAQVVVWKELLKMLPPGVAFSSDLWALRHMVILEERSRRAELDPTIKFSDGQHNKLFSYMTHFGLTPSSRAGVQADVPKESGLEKFLNKSSSKNPFLVPDPPTPIADAESDN